jgi:pyruvate dehydrogenase E2 component (dihydrolipoamide acetyltransferase)
MEKTVELEKEKQKETQAQVPLTQIQKLISQRMLHSKAFKPCFYLQANADVTELMKLRPKLRKILGVKITTNAFYIRALALAVLDFPLMIAKLNENPPGGTLDIPEHINVGFAVNAPQGLVVPVVKDADKKSLTETAKCEKLLTELARSNKLTLENVENETIALSNLGVYGIDSFLGIVPPPASTILAVGNAAGTVVSKDAGVVYRKMLPLTLAVDHRVINGDYAARFLNFIVQFLQNPDRLISEKNHIQ